MLLVSSKTVHIYTMVLRCRALWLWLHTPRISACSQTVFLTIGAYGLRWQTGSEIEVREKGIQFASSIAG